MPVSAKNAFDRDFTNQQMEIRIPFKNPKNEMKMRMKWPQI